MKPVDAFITFEEEDGNIIGQEFEAEYTFSGKRLPAKKQFMGDDFFLMESTEPTNIIWENRHFTAADYAKKGVVVFLTICFLVLVSFGLIFLCKSYALLVKNKYPNVDCSLVQSTYDNS